MKNFWFFDLDGTLADTDRDIREAWKATLCDLGLNHPDFDKIFVSGPPINEMTKTLFPDIYTDDLAKLIRAGFQSHYDNDGFPNTREYPGIMDEVRRLKAAGDYVAIVTNKRYVGAQAMVRHFGWERIFDGVFAGDMLISIDRETAESLCRRNGIGEPKVLRKPELLKMVISETLADTSRSTMVGDTMNDFEAAAKNAVRSIAVPWGYGKPDELSAADAIAVPPFASL